MSSPMEAAQPSLAAHSAGRLGAEMAAAALALLVGIITARALGPEGKGTLAGLLYLAVLFSRGCSLGLGEALTVLVARKELAARETLAVALPGVAVSCLVGAGLLALIAMVLFGGRLSGGVLVVAGAGMAFATLTYLSGLLAMASGAIAVATRGHLIRHLAAAAAVAVLVLGSGFGLTGAVAGDAVGAGVGAVALLWWLGRRGHSVRPVWRPDILRSALRVGVVVEFAYLLVALSQRVDQLFVLQLAGTRAAGHYSIALTLSQLVAYPPVAFSTVSFSRLAYAADGEWQRLVATIARRSLAASVIAAAGLAAVVPVVVPALYGRAYRPAVGPTLVLLPGAIMGGLQWVLCRALAARQRQRAMLCSFGVTAVVMVVLDLVVIGRFGTIGAAAASSAAVAVGLLVAVMFLARDVPTAELVPRWHDFVSLLLAARGLLSRVG